MKLEKSHETLREMFPQLVDHVPVEESYVDSWNDGGQTVTTIWEGPDCHYKTEYNTWAIVHPDTYLQKIGRVKVIQWVIQPKGERIKYGHEAFRNRQRK